MTDGVDKTTKYWSSTKGYFYKKNLWSGRCLLSLISCSYFFSVKIWIYYLTYFYTQESVGLFKWEILSVIIIVPLRRKKDGHPYKFKNKYWLNPSHMTYEPKVTCDHTLRLSLKPLHIHLNISLYVWDQVAGSIGKWFPGKIAEELWWKLF